MHHGLHIRKPRDVENIYLTGKFTLFYHKISLAGFHPHCNFLTAPRLRYRSYHRARRWLCCDKQGDARLPARAAIPRCRGTACPVSPAGAGGTGGGDVPREWEGSHSVRRYCGVQHEAEGFLASFA